MKKLIGVLLLGSLVLISCKKESCPAPESPTIVGFWTGKYGSTTAYPSQGYSALFRANGTVRFFDGTDTTTASKAEGTYTVSGNTVTSTYTYLVGSFQYSVSSTVDAKFTFLEGTYGSGVNTTNGGRWFMNKK
ncbi:MAG: hypothetical protein K2Q24_02850 [Chitinophagaceae bacterium]|nr:hypothetical protein [Chitinophagaceae bacterium]